MVLALPFLPPQQIRATFETVTARCPDDPDHPLRKFVHYIETNWIASTVHPPTTWSAFEASVRTNNDVEGWHHRLNWKTTIHPALYISGSPATEGSNDCTCPSNSRRPRPSAEDHHH
ncbi:uncharacterized protein [Argopecten irradians]|uniref:uncharacterized protein n=1 Tax=Argopecten irradians TaxID=31199 RepID=UPI003719F54F